MKSQKARRLLWIIAWCASLVLAGLAGAFVAGGFQDNALTPEEIELVKATSPTSGPPYSSLEPSIKERGMVPFVRALLSRDDPHVLTLGLKLVRYHRLYLLKRDMLRIVVEEEVSRHLRRWALEALAHSGVSLEEVLQSLRGEEAKKEAIRAFGVAADDMRHDLAARIRFEVRSVMDSENRPLPIRRAAWGALAESGSRPAIGLYGLDESLVEWARKLNLPDEEYARGLFLRDGPVVRDELVGLLESPDILARMWAAHGLVYTFQDWRAVQLLVDSLPRYDVSMDAFGSVGACAFQTLVLIDDGVLLKRAIGHLSKQENGSLQGIVERGQDSDEALLAVQKYLESERDSEAKNAVAGAIGDWLRPRLPDLRRSEDRSGLLLMDQPGPEGGG